MNKIKADKKTLIRWKIYIDRARMYVGYIQFIMIGFVFFEAFRDKPIGKLIFNYLYISIPVIFIVFIGLSLFIGRLDTVYGLREEELRNTAATNPVLRDIQKGIKELREEIKLIKNQKQ